MMRRLSWLAFLLAAGAHAGDTPVAEDFAYGLRLGTDNAAAVYRIQLPEAVYRGVARADLGDLRVFNSAGEVVPHTLRPPALPAAPHSPVPLPIFPFERAREQGHDLPRVEVLTNPGGAVVRVEGGTVGNTQRPISAYLLDASALKRSLRSLDLDWSGPRVLRLAVAESDDLDHWRTVVPEATLARLDHAGHRLVRRQVTLPGSRAPYLRVAWLQDARGAVLTAALAHTSEAPSEPDRNWTELRGQPHAGDTMAWDYDSNGFLPVDRVEVLFRERNSWMEAQVLSRPDPKGTWRPRCLATFYELNVEGVPLEQRQARLEDSRKDRHWRLELRSDRSAIGAAGPLLRLGWRADELVFLARGRGPFLIAYGNPSVPPAPAALHELLRRIDTQQTPGLLAEATVAAQETLGGEARLAAPTKPIPWSRVLLWALLLSGVAVLAWMAWTLGRQMNAARHGGAGGSPGSGP